MKQAFRLVLTVFILLSLCACSAKEPGIVGSWDGSGTVSVIGENAPDSTDLAERWTFSEDGTLSIEVTTPDVSLPAAEFTYTLESDHLTLTANGRSTEYSCALEADTFTLNDTLVFTRTK